MKNAAAAIVAGPSAPRRSREMVPVRPICYAHVANRADPVLKAVLVFDKPVKVSYLNFPKVGFSEEEGIEMETVTRRTIFKASVKSLRVAVVAGLSVPRGSRAQTSRWYQEPQPEVKGRYLAVDNVCAYPNLARLDDGTLIAAIYNQPTHGGPNGNIECWASEDGGRFWKLRGVAAPHEPERSHLQACVGDGARWLPPRVG